MNRLLVACRQTVEAQLHRQLITAQWILTRDYFPPAGHPLYVPKGRLQSIDSIQFYDVDGNLKTWDTPNAYYVTAHKEPAEVYATDAWPSVQSRAEAVQVTFTCGYGDTSDSLPPPIREAILSNIVSIWENKPIAGSPLGGEDIVFQRLLNQHRMPDDWFNYG